MLTFISFNSLRFQSTDLAAGAQDGALEQSESNTLLLGISSQNHSVSSGPSTQPKRSKLLSGFDENHEQGLMRSHYFHLSQKQEELTMLGTLALHADAMASARSPNSGRDVHTSQASHWQTQWVR